MLIRYQYCAQVLDQYLIDIDLRVFAIWDNLMQYDIRYSIIIDNNRGRP